MYTVKALGMIFLAVFLIISGLVTIAGMALPYFAEFVLQSLAVASGVLILVSICKFTTHGQ